MAENTAKISAGKWNKKKRRKNRESAVCLQLQRTQSRPRRYEISSYWSESLSTNETTGYSVYPFKQL